jgi:hypothetical protein
MDEAALNQRQQGRGRLSPDPTEWPDALIQAIRDRHPNLVLRNWAHEEWSRRAALNGLTPAEAWAALERQIAAEMGATIERMLRRERKKRPPRLRKGIATRAQGFCRWAALGVADYPAAAAALKAYCLRRTDDPVGAAEALCDEINRHRPAVLWGPAAVSTHRGEPTITMEPPGGASSGWEALVWFIGEAGGWALQRFQVCLICQVLFFDHTSRAANRRVCEAPTCREQARKQHERRKKARQRARHAG